jgi:two-component system cell cycle sensor histidine kinase/response regulator CckA
VEWCDELSSGLLQAAPDAILVMDQGRIVLLNDRAVEMFGWPRDELLGRHADVLLPGGYPDALRKAFDAPPIGRMGTVAMTVVRRDGTQIPVEASLARVATDQGRVAVAVVRDVSERQRAEAEQSRLRQEAQLHRNHRLEGLGQLAGGIAHDFNNMLGVIVNYANFVIEEASGDDPDLQAIVSDARQVIRAGERGTDLTHQLLAFARREVVRPEVLDLNAVITGVEELLRRTLGEHIRLITRLDPELPSVTWDPGQIEQLLVNLSLNARDAMPQGGQLVVDTGCLVLGGGHPTLAPGDYVRLCVSDSGRGMSADVLERAFEPFFTTKASGEGTGLGLATVYGIVTQAGGDVSITSEPGLGSTVTVLLPAGSETAVAGPAPQEAPVTAGHGETLLVVEDEAALREVAGRILSGAGYKVLTAEGGAQALALAGAHEGAIDLLVSDVVMPGMLGKELAERLVAVRPETRVLFMSGYAQPVLASQGTLDPGVVLLEKPFTAADLLGAVRRRLDE